MAILYSCFIKTIKLFKGLFMDKTFDVAIMTLIMVPLAFMCSLVLP